MTFLYRDACPICSRFLVVDKEAVIERYRKICPTHGRLENLRPLRIAHCTECDIDVWCYDDGAPMPCECVVSDPLGPDEQCGIPIQNVTQDLVYLAGLGVQFCEIEPAGSCQARPGSESREPPGGRPAQPASGGDFEPDHNDPLVRLVLNEGTPNECEMPHVKAKASTLDELATYLGHEHARIHREQRGQFLSLMGDIGGFSLSEERKRELIGLYAVAYVERDMGRRDRAAAFIRQCIGKEK